MILRNWQISVVTTLVLPMVANGQEYTFGSTYTAEQAAQGQDLYAEHCGACHGADLEGGVAAALSGENFRVTWSRPTVTVDDLHFIVSTTMPVLQGGLLSEEEYLEVLAFILQQNDVPAGPSALIADRRYLADIRMASADVVSRAAAPHYVEGVRGTSPSGSGPTDEALLDAAENSDNWLHHTRTYQGTRYSPLTQINTDNAKDLRPQCIYQVGVPGPFQTGPIVHDGVMYINGVHVTAAIDATTCRPIWRHTWEPLDREPWTRNRGVAIKDGYVVRGTADGYLIALDAADGTLLWARQVANPWVGETFTMPPMIFEDMIFIGPAGSENAISGWVGAFRLSDGEPVWRFETVPGATRAGGETWGNPEGILLGGGAIWTPLSLDAGRRELFVAVTNPAPDLPAYLRPGENLYTNSVIALDADTGKLRWHDQIVPADDHDYDLTQVSPIFRARIGSRERNLLAAVGKDGVLHVIDRDSQERLNQTPVTTILNVDEPVTVEGVFACPGVLGGVLWNGPALFPEDNLLITPSVDYCSTFYAAEEVRHVEGTGYLGGRVELDNETWSGWLTAVDFTDGSIRWKYHSPSPMVAAVTTTAGGLVFAGELEGDFMALDARTGDPLYRFQTGGPVAGGIATYAVDGRQFIAVGSGDPLPRWIKDHTGAATIIVFALPE